MKEIKIIVGRLGVQRISLTGGPRTEIVEEVNEMLANGWSILNVATQSDDVHTMNFVMEREVPSE